MNSKSVAIAITVAALTSSLVAVSPASAETRVAVSPATLDLAGPIGGAGTVEVKVTNDGDGPLDLSATTVELQTAAGLPSAVSWTVVETDDYTLKPGTSGVVEIALEIPADAEPHGHYAAVSIDAKPPTENEAQTSGVAGRIVVPVLVEVTGDEENPTWLGEPTVDRSTLFLRTDGQYMARAEIFNAGGTHVGLTGDAIILTAKEDGEPETVATFQVPNGYVLPDRSRMYSGVGGTELTPDQDYELTYELWKPAHGRTADAKPEFTTTIGLTATPRIELAELTVCEPVAGDLQATVSIVNDGTVGVIPEFRFSTQDAEGTIKSKSRPTPELLAWPAETTVATSTMFAPSEAGEYTLGVEVAVGADETLGMEMPIRIGADTNVPSCDMAADSS